MKHKPGNSPHFIHTRSLAVVTTIILILLISENAWPAGSGTGVARVNGVMIYESDLTYAVEATLARRLASLHRGLEDHGSGSDLVDREKTLTRLINIELLYQESLKHRFRGLIEESEERYQAEVARLGSEDKLVSALKCNDMKPEEFRKAIFRKLSIKRLLDKEVYSRIQVTEDEVREFYEQNQDRFRKPESIRISQILIKVSSNPGDDTWRHREELAQTIYLDASKGADFVQLARRHSDDPETASAGGDMGFIQIESLHDIFDTTTLPLEVGTVTKPIRTRNGFQIIKIVSSKPSSPKTLEEVRDKIITLLRREQAREMISQLLSDLRSRAEIEIFN